VAAFIKKGRTFLFGRKFQQQGKGKNWAVPDLRGELKRKKCIRPGGCWPAGEVRKRGLKIENAKIWTGERGACNASK